MQCFIPFQNAEELTEEGLPFLILFHAPEDTESIKKYTALVHTELADQKREFLSCGVQSDGREVSCSISYFELDIELLLNLLQ